MNCIAGVWRLGGGPVEPGALDAPMRAMTDSARADTETLGPVAFARHAPRPGYEALAPQLLVCGRLAVVADARIDARDDLCRALEVPAREREGITDAELILRSYDRWGAGCPEHLIGDYAFAVWDEAARALFCARDHVGARPLFYAHVGGTFVFASTIQGVLAFDAVRAEIDEAEIARFLSCETRWYLEPEHTFFRQVRRLPFGCRLSLASSRVAVERYWRPESLAELTYPSVHDYSVHLSELVRVAVTERLEHSRHVGVHLSGGLDSSALAVIAARHCGARTVGLTAFSWSPPPTGSIGPEHHRIAAITGATGIRPIHVLHDPEEHWRFDDDVAVRPRDGAISERPVVDAAVDMGVDVVVSGWGGDEAASYNGRGVAADHLGRGRWRLLARHCWDRGGRLGRSAPVYRLGMAASVLWNEACIPWLPEPVFHRVHRKGRGAANPLISRQFLSRIRPRLRPQAPFVRDVPGGRANLLSLYSSGILHNRIDAWRMFRSDRDVTHVYPLTDRRILEFVYRVPPQLHVQRGLARYLFREAMSGVLPAAMLWGATKRESRLQWLSQQSRQSETADLIKNTADALPDRHEWVDIPALRRALSGNVGSLFPSTAVVRALSVLTIWRNWCER